MQHKLSFRRAHIKRGVALTLCLGLFLSLFSLAFAPTTTAYTPTYPEVYLPAPGSVVTNGGSSYPSNPGTIYYGATPPNATAKPVVLFLHGRGGAGRSWFTDNDMFSYAYNNGYRAVAVDLYGDGHVMSNGQLLSNLIKQITTHYGVSGLNVVAHSKGGVDTQAAIVFYGAGPYIQREVTLNSPHYGTQLADLAYSWYAGWLASLVGQKSDATYDMQTSYMAYFRSITDSSPNNAYVKLYTTAGTSHIWPFEIFMGGTYLSPYGSNDGVVTVANMRNPNGTPIYTYNLNHYDVAKGNKTFNSLNPYLSTFWRSSGKMSPDEPKGSGSVGKVRPAVEPVSTQALRGGQLTGGSKAGESLTVENGVNSLRLNLLTENPNLGAVAVGPKGERVALQLQKDASGIGDFFNGAYNLTATVPNPSAGVWQIQFDTANVKSASYLLMGSYESALKLDLATGDGKAVSYTPGSSLDLKLSGADATGAALSNLKVEGRVLASENRTLVSNPPTLAFGGPGQAVGTYRLPTSDGIYNLSLNVTGTTADGSPFERSIVTSVLVGKPKN